MKPTGRNSFSWPGVVVMVLFFVLSPVHAEGVAKPFDPKDVQIHVEHGIELPWGAPGFTIEVAGWIPGEALSLKAIAPNGDTLDLLPEDKPVHADEEGYFAVDIDYRRKGFSPGHWMFVAVGKPGFHIFETDLPVVEAPTASRPKWKLTFGQPDKAKQEKR